MLNLHQISVDLQNEYTIISKNSRDLINMLYHKINSPDENTKEVLEQWNEEFKFIYGNINENFSSNKKIKPSELARIYRFNDEEIKNIEITSLFLAIQTYLSLLVRLITYKLINSVKDNDLSTYETKEFVSEVINGEYFKKCGIDNYCYQDWYCWILNSWDAGLEGKIKSLINEIYKYDNLTSMDEFIELHNNDYVKQIYETIIPKQLRHALGEYYTPDWLALYTINKAMEISQSELDKTRFLDPTCGSGTFLFKALQLIRKKGLDSKSVIDKVIGFDINPLAVLTSKTNYIISIIDLINEDTELHLPVYNFDVINSPKENNESFVVDLNNNDLYYIPLELIKNRKYKGFMSELIKSIDRGDKELFEEHVKGKLNVESIDLVNSLYEQLNKHNRFVATVISNTIVNRIEGYLNNKVDIIIGNPPWVNWEYLPQNYRIKSQNLWKEYGIFSVTGRDLSFSKEDISVLITYLVIDKYLKENGFLAFVIRQGLFKSAQNGVGFRKFKVKEDGYGIQALRVDDLSNIKPFENANNSTAIMFIQKNHDTEYPVPYYMWKKKKTSKKASLGSYAELPEILAQIDIQAMVAMPAVREDITSMWITAKKEALDAVKCVLGTNEYKARTGIFTGGANAVYWMQVNQKLQNDNIIVSNITERAKRKVDSVQCEIEKNLVYPLVQGSDLQKWSVNTKSYILCPHTSETKMKPIDKGIMEKEYPLTFAYLLKFKDELDERKGFAGWEKEIQKENFHAILRVGEYTYSKYKVAWRYIATEFITAVISECEDEYLGEKLLIPNEKVMYISTDDDKEAYYLCGILSSDPIAFAVKSYMNPTSISAHVLEKLNIANYDDKDRRHVKISEICKKGHETKNSIEKIELMNELNLTVSEIYNIDKDEMKTINEALYSDLGFKPI